MKKVRRIVTNHIVILFCLVLIGLFLRSYNLNWGAPYYFHPDERNIASSISQLEFPNNLNPNFFAYGSIPIYLVYFVGIVGNYFSHLLLSEPMSFKLSFENAIIIGRVFSMILSVALIPLLYKTATIFVSKRLSLFAAALCTFSVGLIQYAHFGTFEMYLTFFSLLLFYFLLKFAATRKYRYFFIATILIGILSAIKVSSFILFPLPLLIALSFEFKKPKSKHFLRKLFTLFLYSFIASILVIVLFLLGNPFALLDFSSFSGSIQYESNVATGSLPVFYTQTFNGTIPVLYQFLYVFPFLLNPIVWIFILPALLVIGIKSISPTGLKYRILVLFFAFLFFPQAVLFVKWTRYLVPTIPILILTVVIFLALLPNYLHYYVSKAHTKKVLMLLYGVIMLSSGIWTFSLMKTVYFSADTRIAATEAMAKSQSNNLRAISETYDMGIVPFEKAFSSITLFNFYELDNDPEKQEKLESLILESNILILPSQRVMKTRILNREKYPLGHLFYQSLFTSSRFKQIYTTECDMWCSLLYLGDQIYGVEDTANVFDRPTVTIYEITHL